MYNLPVPFSNPITRSGMSNDYKNANLPFNSFTRMIYILSDLLFQHILTRRSNWPPSERIGLLSCCDFFYAYANFFTEYQQNAISLQLNVYVIWSLDALTREWKSSVIHTSAELTLPRVTKFCGRHLATACGLEGFLLSHERGSPENTFHSGH